MKKILIILIAVLMLSTVFVGCTTTKEEAKPTEEEKTEEEVDFKVGMVTDSGTIDDKSFNQGTWEGVKKAAEELGLEYTYLKPTGETKEDYLREIGNLYDTGHRFIVTPGYKFAVAINEAQEKYPDAKFVLVDSTPHAGDFVPNVAENTVAVLYNEHISGFLAGVAVAVELQEGELAFIGGEPVPPVQKYNWGFQQGVMYANENLGTACTMQAENFLYQGTFYEIEAGQQIAAAMFDKGVKAIFCAAGGVGVGAINEAKTRMAAGEEAWIIGVDLDQYADGIYEGDKSVILTSAMKHIELAGYDTLIAENKGEFPGGQILYLEVGVPDENPNLGDTALATLEDVKAKLESGDIVVSDVVGDLYP